MSKPEPICTGASSLRSGRLVHDLRAPLIIAIGFLEELNIYKLRLVDQLDPAANDEKRTLSAEQLSKEIDEEMTLCIGMIKDSLDELDNMLLELREKM